MRKLFSTLLCGVILVNFTACDGNEPDDSNNDSDHNSSTVQIGPKEAIDLGLPSGTLWATCNVGATSPEEYGNYFAWGETTTKKTYYWDTYKYGTYDYNNNPNDYSKLIKYNPTDGKTVLDASDDAATANWGGTWRMPTIKEQVELLTECTWTWTTLNDVNGYRVMGTNGNSIFLPAAGYHNNTSLRYAGLDGNYCSSSLDESRPGYAYILYFYSGFQGTGSYGRCFGQSIRPVCSPK